MANINMRIDGETKTRAESILKFCGILPSQAIRAFYRKIILVNGIPFDIKIPNEITLKTHELAKNGKELHKFDNLKDLFEALEI
ncbi:MAG: type II toxin-antitoxin system RelB/DinJ family antitoxin [Planctomycetota bacterium]